MGLLDTLAGIGPTETIAHDSTATRTTPVTPVPVVKVLSSHGVDIMPYNATHDPQSSSFLAWMWQRMQEDDLVDYYFPGQKETGFTTFVRMMSGDAQVGLVLNKCDSDQWKDKVAGFITWTPLHLGTASIAVAGLIFFREFWDKRTTDEAGALALKYWFTETEVTHVLGVCPSLHVTIARYNKRMGLRETGRLTGAHIYKGEVCDAVLFEITKEEWIMRGHQ